MKTMLKITLVAGLLLLTGCAAQTGVKSRYFWPIGGLNPKIEYIDFYETDRDVKHEESVFAQSVLGEELGVSIFGSPHGVGSRGDGVIAVTDTGFAKVFILDLNKGEIRKLKDIGGEDFFFPSPMDVVFRPDGGGYVSDTGTGKLYQFNAKEVVTKVFGEKDKLDRPNGMAFDAKRNLLYVADTMNHQIAVFSEDGTLVKRLGKRGIEAGEYNFPLDVALAPDGNLLVLDALNARVQVLDPSGQFVRMFGERGTESGSFRMPKAIAVDGFGHVYVTDGQAHKFVIFDEEGDFLLNVGAHSIIENGQIHPGGLDLPKGIAADSDGKIFIVDSLNHMVHRYQFLSDNYLKEHPIREGEQVIPKELRKE